MFRRLLTRFRGRSTDGDHRGSEDASEPDDGESGDRDSGGFLPSRLDASVLYAHGMGDTHAEREIISLQEKERLVEEHRRRRE